MTSWSDQIDNAHFIVPSAIKGLDNGSEALKAVLRPIHDHAGNVVGLAAPVAAQSYDAMVAAAAADGVALRPSSSSDTFRPLAVQQKIFGERYTTSNTGVKGRVCDHVTYFKVSKKVATAACPGTSNHGRGCAIDFDLDQEGSLAWLEAHAKSFGWQWETDEAWHLHYMLGDALPPGVISRPAINKLTSEEDELTFITTPENPQRIVALIGSKLIHVARIEGIDKDQNTWDLSKDPDTWKNLTTAFGAVTG